MRPRSRRTVTSKSAGFALLEPTRSAGRRGALALWIWKTTDGFHMSHPHPEGIGAIKAMQASLQRAGLEPQHIDYINLHGTATPANDAVEGKAVNHLFGDRVICSSTKGWTGHTLGAAGITEAVISALCITHAFVPGTLNTSLTDPTLTHRIALENDYRPVERVFKLTFVDSAGITAA